MSAAPSSRLNAKSNRNFQVYTPTDFIAATTQHIPDKGVEMVRYYGYYSNKSRGVRQRHVPPELVVSKPGIAPPSPTKLPSKKWRDVIRNVWHTDPLRCPKCGGIMRVIVIIDDPELTKTILRHLRLWRARHARLRPHLRPEYSFAIIKRADFATDPVPPLTLPPSTSSKPFTVLPQLRD